MVLGGAYGMFSGVVSVYARRYELVSDIPILLNDTIVFGADFIIDHLGVDLVALKSEVLHCGVICCNATLFLLGLEMGYKDVVGVTLIGVQGVLITSASSDEESPSVIDVDLLDRFGPNVNFV